MTTKEHIVATLQYHKPAFEQLGVSNIGLFGSYLRNEQTLNSDIDIFIDFAPEQETFDNFMGAYDLLEQLFKEDKIEVVTKNGLSKHIGSYILSSVEYV